MLFFLQFLSPIQSSNYVLQNLSVNNISESGILDFGNLTDDDYVLELDGGYLHGQCEVYDNDNKLIGVYDSETSPDSITVAKAKQNIIDNENKSISLYGAYPPDPDKSELIILKDQGYYKSQTFSGAGWRFSEKRFMADPKTGDYLRWTSYVDGGRVGNYNEAYATKNGKLQGTALNAGQPTYNSENGSAQIYYTHNPISGTYYVVENR